MSKSSSTDWAVLDLDGQLSDCSFAALEISTKNDNCRVGIYTSAGSLKATFQTDFNSSRISWRGDTIAVFSYQDEIIKLREAQSGRVITSVNVTDPPYFRVLTSGDLLYQDKRHYIWIVNENGETAAAGFAPKLISCSDDGASWLAIDKQHIFFIIDGVPKWRYARKVKMDFRQMAQLSSEILFLIEGHMWAAVHDVSSGRILTHFSPRHGCRWIGGGMSYSNNCIVLIEQEVEQAAANIVKYELNGNLTESISLRSNPMMGHLFGECDFIATSTRCLYKLSAEDSAPVLF